MWIDALSAAIFDERIKERCFVTTLWGAEKKPILLTDGSGADGIFDEVIIDLNAAVCQVDAEAGPEFERVVEGLAKTTLREDALRKFGKIVT